MSIRDWVFGMAPNQVQLCVNHLRVSNLFFFGQSGHHRRSRWLEECVGFPHMLRPPGFSVAPNDACAAGAVAFPLLFVGCNCYLAGPMWPSSATLAAALSLVSLPSLGLFGCKDLLCGGLSFPPWPDFPCAHRLFNRSASSHIWLMRASMLIGAVLWTMRAGRERMCDVECRQFTWDASKDGVFHTLFQ